MGFFELFKQFSGTGRRMRRDQAAMEKAQANAQIAGIQDEMNFQSQEMPREQAQLRQSMFGRGLGNSTIATQGMTRLTGIQARRQAALSRQMDLANRGLSLIKLKARAARRFMPFTLLQELSGGKDPSLGDLSGAVGGIPDAGGGGANLDEARWTG